MPLPPVTAPEPPVDPATLRFEDAEARARFDGLRAAALARAGGWRHVPLERVGNFVQERWCSPAVGVAACEGGAVVGSAQPGAEWITVATLHYPKAWPEVFGLAYDAGSIPADAGWGVQTSLSLDGRTIAGTTFEATFLHVEGGAVTGRLPVGVWAYTLGETTVRVPPAEGPADAALLAELHALRASPESLRTHVLDRLLELETIARATLAEHAVTRCERGPYRGDGIPPECTLVPLTPQEEAAEAARLGSDLARWRGWVEADATALHAALAGVYAGLP